MAQWLDRGGNPEVNEALLILGTNNLPLLVKRVDYDPQNDFISRALDRLPSRFRNTLFVDRLATRRAILCVQAGRVFLRIGTNAAPAIPDLAAIAQRGEFAPACHALVALATIGAEGLAGVASTARSTNALLRQFTVNLLYGHPESTVARSALTNALTDPDPTTRGMAQFCVTNLYRNSAAH